MRSMFWYMRQPILYAVIIFVVSIIIIVSALYGVIAQGEVAGAFLALLGTFLGALFAFRLNENKDRLKSEKEKKESLNRALFVLLRQQNAMQNILNILSRYKTDFDKAFNLPANQPPGYFDLTQKFEELDFLLESSDPNILLQLSIEQERFEQAIESIRMRNNFYVNEVQFAISQKSLNGRNVSVGEMNEVLGDRLFDGAMNGAKDLYDHVEASAQSIPEMHSQLFALAVSLFPNEQFVKFKPS